MNVCLQKTIVMCWVNFEVLWCLYWCSCLVVAVLSYRLLSGGPLHNEDTGFAGLKIVEDFHSFLEVLWILRIGACFGFFAVCFCIGPMGVPLFYIWNKMEFLDNPSLCDLLGCSRSKGVHSAALAVVYCILPGCHLQILVCIVLHLKHVAGWVG